MKVLYILLVSLIWAHLAGAQVTESSYYSAIEHLNGKAVGLSLKGHANEKAFGLIAAIKDELSKKLTERATAIPANTQGEGGKSKSWWDGVTWQLIIVSFIISLVLGIAFYIALKTSLNNTKYHLSDKLHDLKREVRNLQLRQTADKTNNNNALPANNNEIKDIITRINDLENWIKKLREKIEPPVTIPLIAAQEPQQPEVKKEYVFLSTPNADGSFNDSSASTIYR